MKTRYKFIHFDRTACEEVWICINNRMGDHLGYVKWYRPWRKWMFQPDDMTEYSIQCCRDIAAFMEQLPQLKE